MLPLPAYRKFFTAAPRVAAEKKYERSEVQVQVKGGREGCEREGYEKGRRRGVEYRGMVEGTGKGRGSYIPDGDATRFY